MTRTVRLTSHPQLYNYAAYLGYYEGRFKQSPALVSGAIFVGLGRELNYKRVDKERQKKDRLDLKND